MKLKGKTKGFAGFEDFFKSFKKSKSVSSPRRHVENSRPINDFSLRVGKKLNTKKSINTKWKIILQRAAIFFSLTFLFLILIGILGVLGLVSAYSRDLPNVDKYLEESKRLGKETVIVDRNGVELYRLRGDIVNERLTLSDVPDRMQWAFLAAEDANFKQHKGLDLFGLSRALTCIATNYIQRTGRTEHCGGGSSITQQLIKKTTLTDERSIDRKIKEAILAMRVEEEYSKDQILEDYLNIVPQGREYVGAKTGAVYLFGKSDLSQLTLAEIAYLAAIPNNPEVLSPRGVAYDINKSQERAYYVLDRMYEVRDRSGVTKEEIDAARAEIPKVTFVKDIIIQKAPHFVNQVISELDKDPRWRDQVAEGKRGSDFFRDKGYTIVTSVDLKTQELLEKTIREETVKPQPRLGGRSFIEQTGAFSAAGVVMDVKTGDILAMVGSRDFYAESTDKNFAPEFNASTADRSMGSSVKPILYMTGFTKGYNPLSLVPDLDIDQAPGYRPKNYDRQNCIFNDESRSGRCDFISIRQALRFSLNQPAVSMVNMVSPEEFGNMYVKLTGRADLLPRFQGPASALGSANIPLVDQVHAYTTISDMGTYKPKRYILQIKDDNGNIVYDNTKVETTRVVDGKYPFMITELNKDYWFFASDPTIQQVRKTTDFAGKTGTSDTDRGPGDILFLGYTPDIAIGMWGGNSCAPQECPLKGSATSDDLYKYIYAPFLSEYSKTFKPSRFTRPEGVRMASICSLTGNAYSEDCAKAGGKALQDIVSDTNQPKQEFMIEKLSVAPCPDVLKVARDIDRDAGVAQDIYYVRYDKLFSQKFLSDQVLKYISGTLPQMRYRYPNPYPTQTCDISRSLQPPSITINNPVNGSTFGQSETLDINATVVSDIQLAKVDVTVNNQIVKTFAPKEPVQVSIPLNSSPVTVGTNTVKIIVTNVRGTEVVAQSSFNVITGAAAIVTSPLANTQISYSTLGAAKYVQLTGRVIAASGNVTSANFIVYRNGSPIATIPGNPGGGNSFSGTWTAPVPDTSSYRIELIASLQGSGNLIGVADGIRIIN